MTIILLSDQDTGTQEKKARVQELPLEIFTDPVAEEQDKLLQDAETEAGKDATDGADSLEETLNQEQERILEEARKEAAKILEEAHEAAEQMVRIARKKGQEEGMKEGYQAGFRQAEEEVKARHQENEEYFRDSLNQALEEISRKKEECLRQYLDELKNVALAVAEKVIRVSLKSSGAVISRMIETETEKLRKKDWVKIYIEKEDYEAMIQADEQLIEKLSRLSDNVKFVVMNEGTAGSCIIEMPDEVIDMSVDTQLENIRRLVDSTSA